MAYLFFYNEPLIIKIAIFFSLFMVFVSIGYILFKPLPKKTIKDRKKQKKQNETFFSKIREIIYLSKKPIFLSICVIVFSALYLLYITPFLLIEREDSKNQFKLYIYSFNPKKYTSLMFRQNGERYEELPITNIERNKNIINSLFSKITIIKYSYQQNDSLISVLINNKNLDKFSRDFEKSELANRNAFIIRKVNIF